MIINKDIITQKDIHFVGTKWIDKMHFTSSVNGHEIELDKLQEHGGYNKGPRPKPLILSAIGGCAGMEIISILEKMRIKIDGLEINVSGELTDGQPKMYKSIQINIQVKSVNPDKAKIEKAILLGVDKYCGVVAMARRFAEVSTEIQFVI